jgi:Rho termination factor, N-terminal domain
VADAEQQARAADERVAAAEQVGRVAAVTEKDTSQRLGGNGDLEARSKTELLELAAAVDIEGRANLTKAELISAIKNATRGTR